MTAQKQPKQHLRVVREDDPSPYPKASWFLRGPARLVDLTIAWLLWRVTGPAGMVIALLYLVFADGLFQGQSFGKKLFGVRAVFVPNRLGARNRDSVLRNAPFGLVLVLGMMPDFGLVALAAGAVVVGLVETVKAVRDPLGLRFGDVWAMTQVVDAKVLSEEGIAVENREPARATGRIMRTRNDMRQDEGARLCESR